MKLWLTLALALQLALAHKQTSAMRALAHIFG